MPDPIACLLAVLAAAGAGAVCVLAVGWRWPPVSRARVNAACVSGLGLGLVSGYGVLRFEPVWPPASGLDRFLTIVLPAAFVVEFAVAIPGLPRWLATLARFGLALATGRILLHGSVYLNGAAGAGWWQSVIWLALGGASLAAVWLLLILLDGHAPRISIPLVLSETMLCGGLCVMLAGYVAGGEAALPPAAAMVGVSLASTAIGQGDSVQGTIGIGVVALFSLLFIGRFFGALPTWQAFVVFLAPLVCSLGELSALRMRKPWLAVALRLGLVAIPLIAVLAVAKHKFDRKMMPLLGVAASYRTDEPG